MVEPTVVETPTRIPVVCWDGRVAKAVEDELAAEEPLEIRVRGRAISVTMRTPGVGEAGAEYDAELAAGFLLTEGVIHSAADIEHVEHCGRNELGNVIQVRLGPLVHVDFERLTRHVFASSSCGVCGKATIESIRTRQAVIESDVRVTTKMLAGLVGKMRGAQATFEKTGGLHAAALFDERGELIVVREDVGRHNAVDKVIGHALMRGLTPLSRCVLLNSGRSSFEIMQKAAAGGVPIVAAVSAPSSLAASFAMEMGQTLIGFLRESRMNVYAHPERVVFV